MDTTNDNFTFTCPHCGLRLEAESDKAGTELDCPRCGKTIQIPSSFKQQTPAGYIRQVLTRIKAEMATFARKVSPIIRKTLNYLYAIEICQKKKLGIVFSSLLLCFVLLPIIATCNNSNVTPSEEFQGKYSLSLLSPYQYNSEELSLMADSSKLTSAKRSELWKGLYERGLMQIDNMVPGRQLFTTVPDGIIFEVCRISPANERSDLMVVVLRPAEADEVKGGGTERWEYRHTVRDLKSDGSYRKWEDSYWLQAPWKGQTEKWRKEFYGNYPGITYGLKMLLPMSMLAQIEPLNEGTYVISKGWVSSISVSDGNDRPLYQLGNYWFYPSEETACVVAGIKAAVELGAASEFIVVPPRDKDDLILKRLVRNKGKLPWLNELLNDVQGILQKITLGAEFKYVVEEGTPNMGEFKQLREYAGGKDKQAFRHELDKIIKELDSIQSRVASAEKDRAFKKFNSSFDEKRAFENTIGWKYGSAMETWPTYIEEFNNIWKSAAILPKSKSYYRGLWQALPDDVSFAVKDVIAMQNGGYKVKLVKLEYGESPNGLTGLKMESINKDGKWIGDMRQNHLFWRYMRDRFGSGEFWLMASRLNTSIADLSIGQIIRSKGWVKQLILENSITTKQDSKEFTRKIYFDDSDAAIIFTSVQDHFVYWNND